MSDDSLVVTVNGKDVGLAPLLTRMEQLGKQADATLTAAGQRIGQSIGGGAGRATAPVQGLGASLQKTAREALDLERVYARGQAAAGDYAGAVQRLTTAAEANTAAGVKQIAQTQNQIQAYQRAAVAAGEKAAAEARGATTTGQLSGITGALGGQIAGLIGPAAIASTAIAALGQGAELGRFGAQVERITGSFEELAAEAGTTGAAVLAVGRAASGGELDDLALKLNFNRAQLLGVADSAEDFAQLITIARDRAADMGITTEQAMDSLVTGLGRGSAEILDNLGITIRASEAYATYADGIGKSVSALTDAEKKAAVINAVMAQTAGAKAPDPDPYVQLGVALENLRQKAALLANAQTSESAEGLTQLATGAERLLGVLGGDAGSFRELSLLFGDTKGAANAEAAAAGMRTFVDAIQAGQSPTDAYAASIEAVTAAQIAARDTSEQLGRSTLTAAEAAAEAAQATADAAAAEQVAAVDAQVLTDAKTRLAEQAQAAAQAVIDGGGNIQAIAAQLAASSSQVDVLTAAYLRLLAAQQAAGIAGAARLRGQAANTQDLTGGRGPVLGGPGRTGTSDVAAVIRAQKEQKAETEAAAKASRDQAFALANQAGQARILAGELEKLTPGTAAYITKQTDLLKLEQSIASGRGSRGGGGGGGKTPKLTEAEREQQQLIKGQTDYQNKSLDAAREYEEDLGKIAEDGARERAEAQNKYDLDRRRSAVSFYQSLAGFENQDLARDLSAKYEAAVGQAQEIARTKGADAGQAYLQAQREAIQSQGDLQNEIAKADKDGDKGKAEYYKGLLKMQQDADAEELRQIEAQGSQIAASENAQYATAEQRYAEHLEKMGVAYERKFGNAPPGLAPPPPASSGAGSSAGAAGAAAPGAAGATTGAAGVQLVADPGTQEALDGGLGRVEGVLNDIKSGIAAVEQRVGDVERAVGNIKINSALG